MHIHVLSRKVLFRKSQDKIYKTLWKPIDNPSETHWKTLGHPLKTLFYESGVETIWKPSFETQFC